VPVLKIKLRCETAADTEMSFFTGCAGTVPPLCWGSRFVAAGLRRIVDSIGQGLQREEDRHSPRPGQPKNIAVAVGCNGRLLPYSFRIDERLVFFY